MCYKDMFILCNLCNIKAIVQSEKTMFFCLFLLLSVCHIFNLETLYG